MTFQPVPLTNTSVLEQNSDALCDRRIAFALILSGIFWLLAWYGDTLLSMVALWRGSDTFAHGFLVITISGWMIWRRRQTVAALDLRPEFRALPPLALVGFCWLLGHLAGAGIVQQYALVAMIPLLVWAILGTSAVRALAFPLVFLFFAVPFGDFLLPSLMEHTANFVAFALRLSGIPVYREGQFLMIPSGTWAVVEACSGLRYLIASLTLGVLYSYLAYRSLVRRTIFVALSVIVPIVANWLRAYIIVMVGHLTNMKYAVGIDHLIYGWLFFGIVMLILFAIGSYWREDRNPQPVAVRKVQATAQNRSSVATTLAGALGAAGLVAVWPVAATWMDAAAYRSPALRVPPSTDDWKQVAGRLTDWSPRFIGSSAQFNQTFARERVRAGLYVGYYQNQRQGAQLITSQNVLVPTSDREWRKSAEVRRMLTVNEEEIGIMETRLRGHHTDLLVWHWYWVDGRYFANPYWGKFLQARARLLGRGDDAAVVIVYTPYDGRLTEAEGVLNDFVGTMLPMLTRELEFARRVQLSH